VVRTSCGSHGCVFLLCQPPVPGFVPGGANGRRSAACWGRMSAKGSRRELLCWGSMSAKGSRRELLVVAEAALPVRATGVGPRPGPLQAHWWPIREECGSSSQRRLHDVGTRRLEA